MSKAKKTDDKKIFRWLIGTGLLFAVGLVILRPLPFFLPEGLIYGGLLGRALYILILGCILSLYRIAKGPTGADRIVAIDILGIMIVGLCAVLTISTQRSWYIDIGIAWALQSFISTLALSKYLEGRGFDD